MAAGKPQPDAMQLLTTTLSSSSGVDQDAILPKLRETFEQNPALVPSVYHGIAPLASAPKSNWSFRTWTLDLAEWAICQRKVSGDLASLASQTLDLIDVSLGSDAPIKTTKVAIQVFTTSYPILYANVCTSNDSKLWIKVYEIKEKVLQLWHNGSTGLQIAATKFVIKVIQTQTRISADPRVRNRGGEPNLATCPANHSFLKPQSLEEEANKLVEECIKTLYTSRNVDLLSSLVYAFTTLAKLRPNLINYIVTSLVNWTPSALKGLPMTQIRSAEKSVRLAVGFLSRLDSAGQYTDQMKAFLARQATRMTQASHAAAHHREELASKKRDRISDEILNASKKRRVDDAVEGTSNASATALNAATQLAHAVMSIGNNPNTANFDVTMLPHALVVDLIINSCQVLPDQKFANDIKAVLDLLPKESLPEASNKVQAPVDPLQMDDAAEDEVLREQAQVQTQTQTQTQGAAAVATATTTTTTTTTAVTEGVKAETAPSLTTTSASSISLKPESLDALSDFELPPPIQLSPSANKLLLQSTIKRITAAAADTSASVNAREMAMPLLTRLLTRGFNDQEELDEQQRQMIRQDLFDFVMEDFKLRTDYARLWLSEEWYAEQREKQQLIPNSHQEKQHDDNVKNDEESEKQQDQVKTEDNDQDQNHDQQQPTQGNYDFWLEKILDRLSTQAFARDASNKFITQFIVDLPKLSQKEFKRLARMCNNANQLQVGFTTLRDLTLYRVPLREEALDTLFSLCTHSGKATRSAAIVTLRRWVPDNEFLSARIIEFAKSLVIRLTSFANLKQDENNVKMEEDEKPNVQTETYTMDEAENHQNNGTEQEQQQPSKPPGPTFMVIKDGKVIEGLPDPSTDLEVVQHIELLLALCLKAPDLLDIIFTNYPQMSEYTRNSLPRLMTQLIQSLGPKHPKIGSLIESCPAGSESLVLAFIKIMTDNEKTSSSLVSVIKTIASQHDISPRFLIPVVNEFGKQDIIKHLPRIVSILNGRQEENAMIKKVFTSILTPPSMFGTISSNIIRERQTHLLQPAELMILLHYEEKKIGPRSAIEAINICFSLSDTFKPEILAGFMQQVVDEPTLPMLFLRTVIIAVTTYKSLQPFVATTLLSRLITKKIWTMPQLWEGFIRCAKVIAPHSFGALLQLPEEQLRAVITKQPTLKDGLREYIVKKAGSNKPRVTALLKILGDEPPEADTATVTSASPTPPTETSTPPPQSNDNINNNNSNNNNNINNSSNNNNNSAASTPTT